MKRSQSWLIVLLLTLGALLVHGYHPFAEDAEIYLPGVERILQPELFASDARFFDSYTHFSLFAQLIAQSVRTTHLSLEVALFVWYLLSVFLLLLACRHLSEECFTSEIARWSGVCTIAALLTLPVAGTALYIMDQYVNPRNLAAFAGVFAITFTLRNKYLQACALDLLCPVNSPFDGGLCCISLRPAGIQQFEIYPSSCCFSSSIGCTRYLLRTRKPPVCTPSIIFLSGDGMSGWGLSLR